MFSDNYPSDWIEKNPIIEYSTFATITTPGTYLQLENYIDNFSRRGDKVFNIQQYKNLNSGTNQRQYLIDLFNKIRNHWDNTRGWINCYSYHTKDMIKIYNAISKKLYFGFGNPMKTKNPEKYNIHSQVTFTGFHNTLPIEKQKLYTLFLWSYLILDLYSFYKRKSKEDGNCDTLSLWVYADTISGDDSTHHKSERTMQSILDALKREELFEERDSIEFRTISKNKQGLSLTLVDNIARLLSEILSKHLRINNIDDANIYSSLFGWNFINQNAEFKEINQEFDFS